MKEICSSLFEKRTYLYQTLIALAVGVGIYLLYSNTAANLEKQNIASGFGFLEREAGFEISESSIEYSSEANYAKALWVGVFNTIKVAFWGNILAVLLGVVVGVARLSPNWLLAKVAFCYVELFRNIPLLLLLFFWYALFAEIFPGPKEAFQLLPGFYLSNRGLVVPVLAENPIWPYVSAAFLAGLTASLFLKKVFKRLREERGKYITTWPWHTGLLLGLPTIVWLVGGAPWQWDVPHLGGFNFSGGYVLSPEFASLISGLILYTAAFNAEIVRAGILAVSRGQWEAAKSLGLSRRKTLRLVILPQSLRVAIPPLTGQILNLTKNSSLAVAIGYPDFVSVANTIMNQTGQAIEIVLLIMAIYLIFSLSTSVFMNFYNAKVALVEH